jgi:hypothetical protein
LFTLITTWVSTRIVSVVTVAVLTVAAVPTTLVITQQKDDEEHQQAVLVQNVQQAGDAIIVKLQNAEATCNDQISQVVTSAHIAPGSVQSQLAQARTHLHGSVAPLIAAIQKEQARFQKLTLITPEDEQDELEHLKLIEVTALGGNGQTGTVTVTCQTVTIEVKLVVQVIVVQQVKHETEDDD